MLSFKKLRTQVGADNKPSTFKNVTVLVIYIYITVCQNEIKKLKLYFTIHIPFLVYYALFGHVRNSNDNKT